MHPRSAYRHVESGSRRMLFTLLGIPWTANAKSLQFPVTRGAVGLIAAWVFMGSEEPLTRLAYGTVFGLLLMLAQGLHTTGHTLGGMLVNAPMDENLVTPMSILNVYRGDPTDLPRRIHLARAAGGPLMNLGVGVFVLGAWAVWDGPLLCFFGAVNLALGLIVLLPIAGGDGHALRQYWARNRARAEQAWQSLDEV